MIIFSLKEEGSDFFIYQTLNQMTGCIKMDKDWVIFILFPILHSLKIRVISVTKAAILQTTIIKVMVSKW